MPPNNTNKSLKEEVKEVDLGEAWESNSENSSYNKSKCISDGELIDNVCCQNLTCQDFKTSFSQFKGLSFFHLNIGSLAKHSDNLNATLSSLNLDFKIIGISETRITKVSVNTHNFNLPTYSFISNETESSAGGTALFIHDTMSFKERTDLSSFMYKSKTFRVNIHRTNSSTPTKYYHRLHL